jgi:flagellin
MLISQNMIAINANNSLRKSLDKASKAMSKLSSGLRINKAADDAAGLSISEKMRAQIRGLSQAERNVQDGISLIQTAEGGLSTIQSPPLQRIRELILQAANGTLNSDDRNSIQQEINQMIEHVDAISKNTEFNNIKLLDGSLTSTPSKTNVMQIGKVLESPVGTGYPGTKITINVEIGNTINDTLVNAQMMFNRVKSGLQGSNTAKSIVNNFSLTSTGNTLTEIDDAGIGCLIGGSPSFLSKVTDSSWANGLGFYFTLGSNLQENDTFVLGEIGGDLQNDEIVMNFTNNPNNFIPSPTPQNHGLNLQIGSNAGDNLLLNIMNACSASLGINILDVSTTANCESSLLAIDNALGKVSDGRAELGAFQNSLEHIMSNLSNSGENLTSAESRIRDVDMAKEIMEFTKNNILSQAAQSIIAQANQTQQSVLQLLK